MSELVKTMAEGDSNASDIPLPNVRSNVLHKIVQFMEFHANSTPKEIDKPLKSGM